MGLQQPPRPSLSLPSLAGPRTLARTPLGKLKTQYQLSQGFLLAQTCPSGSHLAVSVG